MVDTPLGAMTAAAENGALTGLWFTGQKYYPQTGGWTPMPRYPVFKSLREWLDVYFSRRVPPPWEKDRPPGGGSFAVSGTLRLEPRGTAFQKAVWETLAAIPFGKLISYGELAKQYAAARNLPSMSAQAAGGAVGHNPISILIPCHRVVGASGSLTGYAGGLDKKKALLRLEGHKL
jgi:methylated-DNA-[protein]-cysteine S-methyltransferase